MANNYNIYRLLLMAIDNLMVIILQRYNLNKVRLFHSTLSRGESMEFQFMIFKSKRNYMLHTYSLRISLTYVTVWTCCQGVVQNLLPFSRYEVRTSSIFLLNIILISANIPQRGFHLRQSLLDGLKGFEKNFFLQLTLLLSNGLYIDILKTC